MKFQPIEGERQCTLCRKCKPVSEFSWDKRRGSPRCRCKGCENSATLARYHRTKGDRGSHLWRPSEAEVAIFREHYPRGGSAAVMRRIPGKTRQQIQHVARNRGIRYVGPHIAGSKPNDDAAWAIPAHDYTPADFALRGMPALSDWRPAGTFVPNVGVVVGVAA